MTRYRWIDSQKAAGFPVRVACRVAEVSSSAYYDYCARRDWGPTEADWDEALLANEIWEVHHRHDDTYGSPRMTGELRRRGYCVNHKRTERLMATLGIYARDGRRKKIRTTIPDKEAPPIPDRIGRDFSVGEPGVRACGDITYIHTDEGWLYLADVEDIGSRRVIGFAMADHMRTELVSAAMTMALECRGGSLSGLTFHHDRGSNTWVGSSEPSVTASGSCNPPGAPGRRWTTPRRRACGPRSSGSWSPGSASPPGKRHGGPSPPGSTGTTTSGFIRPWATSRRSSGSFATVRPACWPHNPVSG